MSLARKQDLAEQLRGELSALRVEKESALQDGHSVVQEEKVDTEIDLLNQQIEMARAERDAAVNGGTVDDALAAMRAAAEAQEISGSVDLAVPLETVTAVDTDAADANAEKSDAVESEAEVSPVEDIEVLPFADTEPENTTSKADGE